MEFADRAAHNEEIFRDINDKIDEGAEQHRVTSALPFHCECGQLSCTETIELMPAEYDQVAANPLRFIVKPGHQIDAVERVIAQNPTYLVVEKVGEARAEIMREHPRQRHRTD
jgi:hypothetical protein